MKWLIDEDNYKKRKLSADEYRRARDLINRGKARDCLGDTLSAMEVTDSDGDLVVDEDMYEEICTALAKKPHKL